VNYVELYYGGDLLALGREEGHPLVRFQPPYPRGLARFLQEQRALNARGVIRPRQEQVLPKVLEVVRSQ
jgi:hypothetical protein